MILISKKTTKRIIKGNRYEVSALWNDGTNQRWIEGLVSLKGLSGRLSVNNFTDTDGNEVPKINVASQIEPIVTLKYEDLSEGDILICKSNSYKTLVEGGKYKIESLEVKETLEKNYSGNLYTRKENFLKFEGISRKLKFNPFRFRKLNESEVREMSLSSLLDDKSPDIIKTSSIRKIDMVENKNKILMSILSKSILDKNRHQLSIIDWAVQVSGTNYSVDNSDYKDIMNMSLSEILTSIEDNV